MQTTKHCVFATWAATLALGVVGCVRQGPEGGSPSGAGTTSAAIPSAAIPENAAVSEGAAASEDKPASPNEELVVLCGHSFRRPMEKLLEMFEQETGSKTVVSFEGSEDFLPKVKLHSVGDIFVSHDPFMQYTFDAGALLRWAPVGYVAPVLVVKKGNPKKLTCFEDLARPGLEVILPNPEFSTCGEMVFALMEKKGIKDAVLKNVKTQNKSHQDTGNQMKLGYGDAAIMWNGVANEFQDAVDIVPCPYEYDEEVKVGVIGLSYSDKLDKVEEFLKFAEAHGKAIFEEFGHVK